MIPLRGNQVRQSHEGDSLVPLNQCHIGRDTSEIAHSLQCEDTIRKRRSKSQEEISHQQLN